MRPKKGKEDWASKLLRMCYVGWRAMSVLRMTTVLQSTTWITYLLFQGEICNKYFNFLVLSIWAVIEIWFEICQSPMVMFITNTCTYHWLQFTCPMWAGATLPLPHSLPPLSPIFCSIFYFSPFLFVALSNFLLFHPFPFYQNRSTLFPGWR